MIWFEMSISANSIPRTALCLLFTDAARGKCKDSEGVSLGHIYGDAARVHVQCALALGQRGLYRAAVRKGGTVG